MPLFTRRKKQAEVEDESTLLQLDEWGSTPLHNACEEGDFEHAKIVCESLSKSNLLKKVLLMKNEEGKTPIDLAIDASGTQFTALSSLTTWAARSPRLPLARQATLKRATPRSSCSSPRTSVSST